MKHNTAQSSRPCLQSVATMSRDASARALVGMFPVCGWMLGFHRARSGHVTCLDGQGPFCWLHSVLDRGTAEVSVVFKGCETRTHV